MRTIALFLALAPLAVIPVAAQAPVIAIIPGTQPKSCLDLKTGPNPKWIAGASIRVDQAFKEYLAAAKANASLKKLFIGKKNWSLDGTVIEAVNAADPWAGRIGRYERTNLIVSNGQSHMFRSIWDAYDAGGQLLGRYDAWMQAGRGSAFFMSLDLYSPNSTATAPPTTAFCNFPGDIQLRKAQAEQEAAEKQARRKPN